MHYAVGFALGLVTGGTLAALYGAKLAKGFKAERDIAEAKVATLELKLKQEISKGIEKLKSAF